MYITLVWSIKINMKNSERSNITVTTTTIILFNSLSVIWFWGEYVWLSTWL